MRFVENTVTRNVAVDDDINWKMMLSEWIVKEQKYQKDVEAWTENSARVYNLVLGHCPPRVGRGYAKPLGVGSERDSPRLYRAPSHDS